jgi:hypothetical protein
LSRKARLVGPAVLGCLGLVAGGCMVREIRSDDRPPLIDDYDDWETVRSNHFVVHTDAGRIVAEAIVSRFEDTYQALSRAFFAQVQVKDVEALVFADASEYDTVFGRDTAGRFIPGLGPTGSLLVIKLQTQRPDRVVAHELVHRFVDAVHPRLPNWMDEGIAMFFQSIEVRDDELLVGESPRRVTTHGFAEAGGVSFRDLVKVPLVDLYGPDARFYYAAAWALVHYLMTGAEGKYRARFSALLLAMEQAHRQGHSAEVAFAEVYPDIPLATLDDEVERLTRNLNRPGVETLLVLPFQRRPAEAITRKPARREEIEALVEGAWARRLNPPPGAPPPLVKRRRFAGAETEMELPPRYFGVSYGQTVLRPQLAWETELGLGPFGYQTAARARYDWAVGEGGNFFVVVGLGPMLAVKSQALGLEVERYPDQPEPRGWYYHLVLDPQLAAEVRTPSRLIVRFSVSGHIPIAGNLSTLCSESRGSTVSLCDPADRRSGARTAQLAVAPLIRFGLAYGW